MKRKLLYKIKTTILLFYILSNFEVLAQEQKPEDFSQVMTLTKFWETVFSEDTVGINLDNIYVITKDENEYRKVRSGLLAKKKIINKSINVNNIYFKGYYLTDFRGFHSGGFNIDSTTFLKPFKLSLKGIQGVFLNNCTFKKEAEIKVDKKGWLGLHIENCTFKAGYFFGISGEIEESTNTNLRINNSEFMASNNWRWFNRFNNIEINNSTFHDTSKYLWATEGIIFGGESNFFKSLIVKNSNFKTPIHFTNFKINETIRIESSKLSYIGINTFKLPEDPYEFFCKWTVLDSAISFKKEIEIFNVDGSFTVEYNYYNLYSDSSIYNQEIHDELKSKLYQIYNIYKAQGDIESSNSCYRDIKIFENKRWKYLYELDPTFEKWFKWRLNELISYYSDYGTNPAKAVIKSLWVIIFFTLFYMFFPSEWDISSKSAIIANFKQAVTKKEKTTSPLLKAFLYLLVSFANGFTLSINSFVTLGFGHIPTKGVAKYFTILQGFIGWFLLTIFSVSLISQILN